VDGRSRYVTLAPGDVLRGGLSWSRDGRRLADVVTPLTGAAAPTRLVIHDAASGRTRSLLRNTRDSPLSTTWSPRGHLLAVLRDNLDDPAPPRIDIVDTRGRVLRRGLAPDASNLSRISWSPDGDRIVYRRRVGQSRLGPVRVLDLRSGRSTTVLPMSARATDPAWSPSGQLIAYASDHGIAIATPDGRSRRRLTRGGRLDEKPIWSPDGHWIAYTHMTRACTRPPGDGCEVDLFFVSPDAGSARYVLRTPDVVEREPVWGP